MRQIELTLTSTGSGAVLGGAIHCTMVNSV